MKLCTPTDMIYEYYEQIISKYFFTKLISMFDLLVKKMYLAVFNNINYFYFYTIKKKFCIKVFGRIKDSVGELLVGLHCCK